MTSGRVHLQLGLLLLAGAILGVAAPSARGTAGAPVVVKPVIAPATLVPAQAVAGQRLTVTHKVTRSDNGRPLTTGRMICDPSSAGKVISHAESFRGRHRPALVRRPGDRDAGPGQGDDQVRQSATRITNLAVKQAAEADVSIGDATVTEGNSGTTRCRSRSRSRRRAHRRSPWASRLRDGTAVAPGDYTAASGSSRSPG